MSEIRVGGEYRWGDNPFAKTSDRITVIDIKQGWCQYVTGCVWFNKLFGITFTLELDKAERWWHKWE
jgi:hypothetical protein